MLTPIKAIRAKCLDCCCGQRNEVVVCPCADCPLYPYRFGKNPNRAGIGSKGASLPKTSQLAVFSGKILRRVIIPPAPNNEKGPYPNRRPKQRDKSRR